MCTEIFHADTWGDPRLARQMEMKGTRVRVRVRVCPTSFSMPVSTESVRFVIMLENAFSLTSLE